MNLNKNGNESGASKRETAVWVRSICKRVSDGDTARYDEALELLWDSIHSRAKREGYVPTQVTQSTVSLSIGGLSMVMTTLTVSVASIEFLEQQQRMQQLAGAPGPRRVS